MDSYNDGELETLQNNKPKPDIFSGLGKPLKPEKPLGERRKAVFRQVLMVICANSGVCTSGMTVAMPAVTLNQLTNETEPFHLDSGQASWYASIPTLACPLGGLIVGYLLDKIGRKRTMLLNNLVGIIGWGLMASALQEDSKLVYIQVLTGRFICGLMVGLFCSPTGVYTAEITLPNVRGKLLLGTSVGLSTGILLMYILGYVIRDDWRTISIVTLCYQIIAFCSVLPMPESPSWLMQNRKVEKSRKSLMYFRGLDKNDKTIYSEFETELSQINKSSEIAANAGKQSFFNALKDREVYMPFLIMIGMFVFQQFSGVVVVVVYAVQIAIKAGVAIDPVLCAVLVALARLITTCCMGYVLEKWGRRPAGMVSATGMSICMLTISVSSWFPVIIEKAPFLPAICIVLQFIFSTLGLLTLPFYMISEVYPQKVRGVASGLTVCIGLVMSFIVLQLYPTMDDAMGYNVFTFYGLVSLAAVFYVYFILPETKGRTLLEIEEYFKTGSFEPRQQNEPEITEVFVKK